MITVQNNVSCLKELSIVGLPDSSNVFQQLVQFEKILALDDVLDYVPTFSAERYQEIFKIKKVGKKFYFTVIIGDARFYKKTAAENPEHLSKHSYDSGEEAVEGFLDLIKTNDHCVIDTFMRHSPYVGIIYKIKWNGHSYVRVLLETYTY